MADRPAMRAGARLAIVAFILSIAACSAVTPQPSAPPPTALPSPDPTAAPSGTTPVSPEPVPTATSLVTLSIHGAVAEFCGSIGGCAYYVEVVGPDGKRERAKFDYRSNDDLVILPSELPPLSEGRHTLTATSFICSDVIENGVRDCGTMQLSCDHALTVVRDQVPVTVEVVFRREACTITSSPG